MLRIVLLAAFMWFAFQALTGVDGPTTGPRRIADEDITPPGARLQIGEEAFVEHRVERVAGRDRVGVVAITVAAIELGDRKAFAEEVGNSKGWEPYYIRARIENVSGEDLGKAAFTSFGLVLEKGRTSQTLIIGGESLPGMGTCHVRDFPLFADAGTVVETCTVDAVRKGEEPVGVRYQPPGTPYADKPIIWRR